MCLIKLIIDITNAIGILEKLMKFYSFRKVLRKNRVYAWRKLGCAISENVKISSGVYIKFPSNVSIGSGTAMVGKNINIDSWGNIQIGKNVLINENVSLFSAGHPIDDPDFGDGTEFIKIGDYVWMPHNIIVLPGVSIGNYAVIGTGSVVSRDVPDYGVAVGNPVKIVKERARIKYNYVPSEF